MNKFYVENQDMCCLGLAVGRVPLRIIGAICIGLGIIQIGLSSYVYTCYTDIKFGYFDNGAWWAGVACVITGCLGVWAFNRGVVIAANVSSVISTLLGGFAIYVDKSGIDPLLHSNPTYKYCAQSFAATFIFDIVVTAMSLTMLITTLLSLIFPSVFQEIDIEKYRRQKQGTAADAAQGEQDAENPIQDSASARVEYNKNSLYDQKDSFNNPNPQLSNSSTRIVSDPSVV